MAAHRLATLRARTTLLATAITAIGLVLASVLLVAAMSTQLTRSGDDSSRSQARELLRQAAEGDLPRTIDGLDDESVAQVIAADGTVLSASANVAGRAAIIQPGDTPDALSVRTVDGPDDDETERYRVWSAKGSTPEGSVTVLVGRSLESVSEATATLRAALLFGVPLVLAMLATGIWMVVGRALARIDQITTTVAEIDERDLHRRVPEGRVDDEVSRLASTMNRMLGRLEDANARQRAFVADASHDLQSPLTSLRTRLEVALAHPDDVDVDELGRELLAESAQMEALVQNLLQVAAGDRGVSARDDLIDLDALVLEEVTRLRTSSAVHLDTHEVSAAPVRGDATELRRLVRNLLDNAVRHARRGVRVSLATGTDAVVLDVLDDGPGVAAEARPHIFDRFFRGDPARGSTGSGHRGSGLGLAIALSVAEWHGGSLELVTDPGTSAQGAHFRLRLPLVP